MIRKHSRFTPHLNETDILFNWTAACRIGTELSLLAEELSRANEFPAAEVVLGMKKIFKNEHAKVSTQTMREFTEASMSAYRTEHSAYVVGTDVPQVPQTERRRVHVFLKFFQKTKRHPFHTVKVVVGEDGNLREFLTV